MYANKAFKKLGKRISHLLHRHEIEVEYQAGEPGYAPAEPGEDPLHKKPMESGGSWDPKGGKYKHRVGQRSKPGKYRIRLGEGKASKKEEEERAEYTEPNIRELKEHENEATGLAEPLPEEEILKQVKRAARRAGKRKRKRRKAARFRP